MTLPQNGTLRIVEAYDVEKLTLAGWVLLQILEEDTVQQVLEQHQPDTPMGQSFVPPPVMLHRCISLKTHRYVMHLEQGSVVDQLNTQLAEQKKLLDERDRLLAEKDKELKVEREALAQSCRTNNDLSDTISKQNDHWRALTDQNKVLQNELDALRANHAPFLDDLSKIIKALGVGRLSQILGREVTDPDPIPEDQLKNTYERLLEEDDDANAQAG